MHRSKPYLNTGGSFRLFARGADNEPHRMLQRNQISLTGKDPMLGLVRTCCITALMDAE